MHAVVCHREGLRPSFTALLGALVADDSELTPQGLDWPGEGTRAWPLFQKLGSLLSPILAPELPLGLVEISVIITVQFIFSLVQFCFMSLQRTPQWTLLHSNLRGSRSVSKITWAKTIILHSLLNFSLSLPNKTSWRERLNHFITSSSMPPMYLVYMVHLSGLDRETEPQWKLWEVLVQLGCYDGIPQTGWLISNRNLFLTVLEAGSPRSGCQHGQVNVPFWGVDFLLYFHMAGGARELCGISFQSWGPPPLLT